jgi:hypothetical protein
MKRIIPLFVCLTISIVSFGQEKPASVPVASELPPGPSMKETEAWIKRELRAMGSDHVVTKYQDTSFGTKYEIESAVLLECRLTMRTSEYDEIDGVAPKRRTQIATVTLKDVDVEKLQSKEIPVDPGFTMSKPSYRIVVFALADRGDAFELESDGYAGGKKKAAVRAVGVRVREQSMANQAVQVFRRAAILCGAPSQSAELSGDELKKVSGRYNEKENSTNYIELRADGTFVMKHDAENLSGNYKIEGDVITLVVPGIKEPLKGHLTGNTITNEKGVAGWEKSADSATSQSQTSKPESPATSKMTNEEVIQLVAAGLSEQVIITSIRQAPTKDFDVTPNGLILLKKAKVPDAVIAVMQEKGTSEQAPSTSDTKTPPKYDANLAKPEKPTAPPVSQNGCDSIELMGLYTTDMRPAAPLIVYLAKIRNGTNITRIVNLRWLNMYGQDMESTTQVGAGQIVTLQLSRNSPVDRQPINLRLSSCR